mmetsp:Transcript_68358/g.216316  ORF Transcript_68358/g.216316 Transcript_68358/m.216316 type:complete len:100 (-) Transcript_68358:1145-1444(-)
MPNMSKEEQKCKAKVPESEPTTSTATEYTVRLKSGTIKLKYRSKLCTTCILLNSCWIIESHTIKFTTVETYSYTCLLNTVLRFSTTEWNVRTNNTIIIN